MALLTLLKRLQLLAQPVHVAFEVVQAVHEACRAGSPWQAHASALRRCFWWMQGIRISPHDATVTVTQAPCALGRTRGTCAICSQPGSSASALSCTGGSMPMQAATGLELYGCVAYSHVRFW